MGWRVWGGGGGRSGEEGKGCLGKPPPKNVYPPKFIPSPRPSECFAGVLFSPRLSLACLPQPCHPPPSGHRRQ